jgi:hypothetical protein
LNGINSVLEKLELKMATETKRISQQQLMEKLRDINISDEELAQYFVEDKKSTEAFNPTVTLNPKKIS